MDKTYSWAISLYLRSLFQHFDYSRNQSESFFQSIIMEQSFNAINQFIILLSTDKFISRPDQSYPVLVFSKQARNG